MAENSAVPMVVLARQQDHVEFLNRTLRQAGHAVHCHWIAELQDLGDALMQINSQLVVAVVGDGPDETANAMQVFKQFAPQVPALIMREQVDENIIADAMKEGARDVVTFHHPARLQAVVSRELNAYRQERKLLHTVRAAHEYREQLKTFMSGAADAIVQVQEGIVVDANPAWLELLGYENAEAMVGNPIMDCFDPDTHQALKGALAACLQGRWTHHDLKVTAVTASNSVLALNLTLKPIEVEGEPAVQLCVPLDKRDKRGVNEQVGAALELDATTKFLQKRFFLSHLATALTHPPKSGVRELVCLRVDKYEVLSAELGPQDSEEFVGQLAALVQEQLQSHDLASRFGDCEFLLLLERGAGGDVAAWCNGIVKKVAAQLFQIGNRSTHCTCSIGVNRVPPRDATVATVLHEAQNAATEAQQKAGNRLHAVDHIDEETQRQNMDKLWVRMIKGALMENRFRLMQQPIASLSGEHQGMYDVMVRMLDENKQEVLPTEFLAAAERNDLMKNIDRWVIGAAMSFCGQRKVQSLFVRLSKDSLLDRSLPTWLNNQLKASRVEPGQVVFQISEKVAAEYLAQTQELGKVLVTTGFRLALEHAGTGRDPVQLLEQLPWSYCKLDGSLMQSLSINPRQQEDLKRLVDASKQRKIATIAERVGDANTMAVLWQLGLEYIEGYFVNEPEQVTLG